MSTSDHMDCTPFRGITGWSTRLRPDLRPVALAALAALTLTAGRASDAPAEPAQPPPFDLTRLAEVPSGPLGAVSADGAITYLGLGPRLVAIDIGTGMSKPLGMTDPFTDTVRDVALAGDIVVVAAGSAGLRLVDRTLPGRLTERSVISGEADQVEVAGGRAYVLGADLRVYDIANPAAPRLLGRSAWTGADLDVLDRRVYLAGGQVSLSILDYADPAAPRLLGTVDTPGEARGVAATGTLALLADGAEGLRVIDVADPAAPREVGVFEVKSADCFPGGGDCQSATRVVAAGGVAYLAVERCDSAFNCRVGASIRKIDLGSPSAPFELARHSLSGNPTDLELAGDRVVLAESSLWWYNGIAPCSFSPGGFSIMDTELQEIARFGPPGTFTALAATSSHLFVVDPDQARMDVFDVSDPASPEPAGSPLPVTTLGDAYGSWIYTDVAIGADRVYLTRGSSYPDDAAFGAASAGRNGRDPSPLTPQNGCAPAPPDRWFRRVRTSGDHPLVLDRNGMLQVLDIGGGSAVGRVDSLSGGRELAVSGTFAYVAGPETGLQAVDIADTEHPALKGTLPGPVGRVHAVGTLVYVAAGEAGVRIVDASDPAAPRQVGAFGTRGLAMDIFVADGRAYVADSTAGLIVVDVRDPGRPVALGQYLDLQSPRRVHVVGTTVYVLADGGLFVLGAPTPGEPTPQTPTPRTPTITPTPSATPTLMTPSTGQHPRLFLPVLLRQHDL